MLKKSLKINKILKSKSLKNHLADKTLQLKVLIQHLMLPLLKNHCQVQGCQTETMLLLQDLQINEEYFYYVSLLFSRKTYYMNYNYPSTCIIHILDY